MLYIEFWTFLSLRTGGADLLECAWGNFAPCISSWTISRDTSGENSCPNFVTHTGENYSNSLFLKHDFIFALAVSTDKFCGFWKSISFRIFHRKSQALYMFAASSCLVWSLSSHKKVRKLDLADILITSNNNSFGKFYSFYIVHNPAYSGSLILIISF